MFPQNLGFRRSQNVLIRKNDVPDLEDRFRFLSSISGIPHIATYVGIELEVVKDNPKCVSVQVVQDSLPQLVDELVNHSSTLKALRGLMTLEASYPMFMSASLKFRMTVSNTDIVLIDWGSEFLFGGLASSSGHSGILDLAPSNLAFPPNPEPAKDILAELYCLHASQSERPVFGLDHEYLPSRLVNAMSKKQVWRWMEIVAPAETMVDEYLDCEYNTVVSSPEWETHTRIQSYIESPSEAVNLVTMLRTERLSIPPPDRTDVYSFFLRIGEFDECELPYRRDSDPDGFLNAFGTFLGECPYSKRTRLLSEKFKNRVLRDDATDMVIRFMQIVDIPLAEHVLSIGGKPVISHSLESLLSNALSPTQVATLWDTLLVDAPELLIRVTAFLIMELRELVMECEDRWCLTDLIRCSHELIADFHTLLQLGIDSSDVTFNTTY